MTALNSGFQRSGRSAVEHLIGQQAVVTQQPSSADSHSSAETCHFYHLLAAEAPQLWLPGGISATEQIPSSDHLPSSRVNSRNAENQKPERSRDTSRDMSRCPEMRPGHENTAYIREKWEIRWEFRLQLVNGRKYVFFSGPQPVL